MPARSVARAEHVSMANVRAMHPLAPRAAVKATNACPARNNPHAEKMVPPAPFAQERTNASTALAVQPVVLPVAWAVAKGMNAKGEAQPPPVEPMVKPAKPASMTSSA